MHELILIRHGQASAFGPVYDVLSDLGHEQGRVLGGYLQRRRDTPTHFVRGPRARHISTSDAIREGWGKTASSLPEVEELPGLDEYPATALLRDVLPGLMEEDAALRALVERSQQRGRDGRRAFGRVLTYLNRAWIERPESWDGIEPWSAYNTRIEETFQGLIERGLNEPNQTRIFAVTSAGTIASMVAHLLSGCPEKALRLAWTVHNASLTRVYFNKDMCTLHTFNTVHQFEMYEKLITFR